MKDFYDICLLARECKYDGSILVQALVATFENRETEIPLEIPIALSNEFAIQNQGEWSAFLQRTSYEGDEIGSFIDVIDFLREFLLQPMQSAAKREDFLFSWTSNTGWIPS